MPTVKTAQFNETSWAEIQKHIQDGEIVKIGSEFTDKLQDGTEFTVVAAHNVFRGKYRTVFIFKTAPFRSVMNEEYTNAGGWKASYLRKQLKEFYEKLPEDLKAVIKKKKTIQVMDGEEIKCKDKLWIPTEYEVFGEDTYGEAHETEEQIDYFKDPTNRVFFVDGEQRACYWWESSPYVSYSTSFCNVGSSGAVNYGYASGSFGVVPCFLIG